MIKVENFITLSIVHIKEETVKLLDMAVDNEISIDGITVYDKEGYGWFLYPYQPAYEDDTVTEMPSDIKDILSYAKSLGDISLIILDVDGPTTDNLPTYERRYS